MTDKTPLQLAIEIFQYMQTNNMQCTITNLGSFATLFYYTDYPACKDTEMLHISEDGTDYSNQQIEKLKELHKRLLGE